MKIKETRPDGTVVEAEGSAEELAEFERKKNEEQLIDGKVRKPKQGKRILNEEDVRRIAREVAETVMPRSIFQFPVVTTPCTRPHSDDWWIYPNRPIWIDPFYGHGTITTGELKLTSATTVIDANEIKS